MDIQQPLPVSLQPTLKKAGTDGLDLKLNQVVTAKVIDTQIMLDTLTLKINEQTVNARGKFPTTIQPGQALQLQVVKLLPSLEFKIITAQPEQSGSANLPKIADPQSLKLVTPVAAPADSVENPAPTPTLTKGQAVAATVVSLTRETLTLQLSVPDKPNSSPVLLTLTNLQLVSGTSAGAGPEQPRLDAALLRTGTPLTVTLVQGGDTPRFKLAPVAMEPAKVIQQALKTLLPAQDSPIPLLQQLQTLLPQLRAQPSVAEALKSLAQEILSTLPSKTVLSIPEQLKQSVSQSGLFLESKLLALLAGKPEVSLQGDFKLKLGQLVQMLQKELIQPAPDATRELLELLQESLQKARGALAGLTLDQLSSLPRDESPKQVWTLELPFFHEQAADSIQIEIEQDKSMNEGTTEKSWAVSITMTPPGLDTIHCRISCYDGSVNTRFWSEGAETVDRINAYLSYLKEQFEKNGLSSGFMQAQQGHPAPSETVQPAQIGLLREKA